MLRFQKGSLPFMISDQNFILIYYFSHMCFTPNPPHPNNICKENRSINYVTLQNAVYSISCHFLFLRHLILKQIQFVESQVFWDVTPDNLACKYQCYVASMFQDEAAGSCDDVIFH
jgi:hypothetical protein